MNLRDRLPVFVRYALVGGFSFLLYNGLSMAGAAVTGISPNTRNALLYLLVLVMNFLGQRFFVFHRTEERETSIIIKFFASAVATWTLNQGLFALGYNVLGLPDIVTVLISSSISPLASYLMNARLVFRTAASPQGTPRSSQAKPCSEQGPLNGPATGAASE